MSVVEPPEDEDEVDWGMVNAIVLLSCASCAVVGAYIGFHASGYGLGQVDAQFASVGVVGVVWVIASIIDYGKEKLS